MYVVFLPGGRDMVTSGTWARVDALAREDGNRTALSGAGWSLTYGELAERAHESAPDAPHGVARVLADRRGEAVVSVLAAQRRGTPALVLAAGTPDDAQDRILATVRDAATAVPLRGLVGGLLTTTSGSTGTPKIVVHDPAGIDRFADWARTRFALDRGTTSLSHSPLNFDVALLDVWAVLRAGGRVHFAAPDLLTDGRAIGQQIEQERVTLVQTVPAVLRLLAAGAGTQPSVRTVVSTGDFFPAADTDALRGTFPSAEVVSIYGATETNDTFVADVRSASDGLLGDPLPGVRWRVDAPDGERQGRLVVQSPFQALGYLGAQGPDPWHAEADGRWFTSGDLVEITAHGLRLHGRVDRVAKIRGHRVSLDDVESVLRAHPDVLEAVVLAVPGDEARLEAVVRTSGTSPLSTLALRTWLAARLPRAALPGRIWPTTRPFLQTTTGKTDRRGTHQTITTEELTRESQPADR